MSQAAFAAKVVVLSHCQRLRSWIPDSWLRSGLRLGYCATINAGDAVRIPAGWVACEQASSGALVYGLRKSWAPKGAKAKRQYKLSIDLLRKASRSVAKMES
eukprot:7135074-Alexandrium_andersonii.AAC.1